MAEIKFVKCDLDLKVQPIKEKRWNPSDFIWMIVGLVLIGYFFGIILFAGFSSIVHLVWLMGGCLLIGIGFIPHKKEKVKSIPTGIKRLLCGFIIVCMTFFLVMEGVIVNDFSQKGVSNLDYIIVLGAKIKDSGPSRILKQRLDEAAAYLNENPKTQVIVAGGRGADEPISEAAGMKTYLMETYGITEDRIILEESSTSTYENLFFSKGLIASADSNVGIVSSNFHIYRAVQIAKKAGYKAVCGISAYSEVFLLPANMVREFIGIMKDRLVGNMNLLP